MATIAFPISLATFFSPLAVAEAVFDLSEAMSATETGGGEILRASYGPRLWQGRVTVRANTYLDLDRLVARAELLRQPGASFFVHPSHRRGPQADPTGATLGSASPTVTGVAANNREITLAGLPGSYVLTEGDFLSFTYLSNPTRYALHRVMETRTATGGGGISNMEVSPVIRPGATWPRALTLVQPFCKAVIVPDSFDAPVTTHGSRAFFSFAWRQTLR
jgi:hypothetical protein